MSPAPSPNPPVKPSPSSSPALPSVWPRSAQWTTAFLLGVVTTLLGFQALTYLRWGSRPTQLDRAVIPAYRVDLNHATREELLQLPGVGDHMADRIGDLRRQRGRIRSVDELNDVPGIGPATMDRLRDWVRVDREDEDEEDNAEQPPKPVSGKKSTSSKKISSSKKTPPASPLDINRATAEQLMQLEGIGPTTAQRIVEERRKEPFRSVDDLSRVPRLKGKTLDKIRPYVTVTPAPREIADKTSK
ncbi:MAG: ComEA family DNA-binding protein [Gemmataceae bacterium]